MAPVGDSNALSARRAQYAGPPGLKGLIHNGKTTSIACFAALGGLVYGYNQGKPFYRTLHSAHTNLPARQECLVRF